MPTLTCSAITQGSQAQLITIESSTTSGFAGLQLVGNASELCRDGKERARTALEGLGYKLGHKRILINFSPADARKEGNHFDLPMALSLAALVQGKDPQIDLSQWLLAGEIGLDGSLRPTRSIIPLCLAAIAQGLRGIICAEANLKELAPIQAFLSSQPQAFRILGFRQLKDAIAWAFLGEGEVFTPESSAPLNGERRTPDFDDMHLTPEMERIVLACAAGGHSLLMRGAPGTGKSMLAQRLPSVLKPMPPRTHLESLQIYSQRDESLPLPLLQGQAPFRSPHHSSSPQALLGTAESVGELSLAHGGLLFLDELPEFRRDLLESLREPLETGLVHVARAHRKVTWRARAQLIAACNDCPCGNSSSKKLRCECSPRTVQQYQQRLSRPFLERIDIHLTMKEPKGRELRGLFQDRMQNLKARRDAAEEFALSEGRSEKDRTSGLQDILEPLPETLQEELLKRLETYHCSSRTVLRLLRVSRTLADLDASRWITPEHLEEAARWRPYSVT